MRGPPLPDETHSPAVTVGVVKNAAGLNASQALIKRQQLQSLLPL
jgi:hypothetical protein